MRQWDVYVTSLPWIRRWVQQREHTALAAGKRRHHTEMHQVTKMALIGVAVAAVGKALA